MIKKYIACICFFFNEKSSTVFKTKRIECVKPNGKGISFDRYFKQLPDK